ncbi:MAG: hypothetical protein AAGH74_09290 [Pseudomonadota bacterium]
MSIIRLSMLSDGLYAPDARGTIESSDFRMTRGKDRRGTGKMPLYPRGTRPKASDAFWKYLARSLEVEASNLADDKPVTVFVHGFQFDPATVVVSPPHHHKADNPHARLYHFERHELSREMKAHSTSWPLGLGFEPDDAGAEGLCIGFGWYSNPGFFSSLFSHGKNFYAKAYENAEVTAWQLTCLLDVLCTVLQRPVDLFCHSLGSRVAIRAMAMAASPLPDLAARETLPPGQQVVRPVLDHTGRVLLLAGAEKVLEAQLMMTYLNSWKSNGPTGVAPDFYNFISRENDVLDKLGENFGPAAPGSKQVIGHNGLESRDPAWLDVQLDDPDVAAWFKQRNYTVSGDNTSSIFAVLDHWIHYTWPDNMRVYHDILRDRGAWEIGPLKAAAPAEFDRTRLNRGPSARVY